MDIRIRTAAIVASVVLVAAVAIAIYPLLTGGRGVSLTTTTTQSQVGSSAY